MKGIGKIQSIIDEHTFLVSIENAELESIYDTDKIKVESGKLVKVDICDSVLISEDQNNGRLERIP